MGVNVCTGIAYNKETNKYDVKFTHLKYIYFLKII